MKSSAILLFALALTTTCLAQTRYYTKTGTIQFSAGTPLEDIDALNKSTTSVLDVSTGQIEFAVLIKGFEFRRGLMQEHFNENYMESGILPKATFKGKFEEVSAIDFKKDGNYPVKVKGILEIHGVKKEVIASGMVKINGGNISTEADFQVRVEDYEIKIPGAVKDKISPTVTIHVKCDYKLL